MICSTHLQYHAKMQSPRSLSLGPTTRVLLIPKPLTLALYLCFGEIPYH